MTFEQQTMIDMGILSSEVYDARNRYFAFNADGTRIESIIVTDNATYTIIDSADTVTDMQALLLKNESTGQFVIAFRGTEATAGDIISDILNGVANYNPQVDAARAFVQKALDNPEYNISTSNLTLTGHSLGGILSQQVGAALHIQGYAFNPYGVDRLLLMMPNSPLVAVLEVALYQIMKAVGLGDPQAAWAKDNILNISFNDFETVNGDILSNIVTELTSGHLGSYLPIYGKDVGLEGHLMSVLNPAIAHYNAVLSHFTDKNYNLLTAAYVSVGDYEKTEKIFSDAGVYQASGLKFNFLIDDSASSIAAQAKGDKAVLYALAKLNPFAIEGNLPAYANLNRTDMSAKYIEDRAQYLYYLLDKTNRYDVDPTLSMTHYEDAALGADYTLEQTFSRSRVLFGGVCGESESKNTRSAA